MNPRLKVPIGHNGKHIRYIHRNMTFGNPQPFPFCVVVFANLQCCNGLLEDERYCAVVCVSPRIEFFKFGVLGFGAGAVHHVPKTAVAVAFVAVAIYQFILGNFEDYS